MNLLTAVYAGSFDPVTNGHIDIIRRAARLFGRVTVLLIANGAKRPLFSVEERAAMLKEAVADQPNVHIDTAQGLLADYVKTHGIDVLVRGIRNARDVEEEQAFAFYNGQFCPSVQTVWLPCTDAYRFVSSSAVREIARCGGDVQAYVPACVAQKLAQKQESH